MAKYDADQLKELGAKGHAFKNADGSFSYPIEDSEDLGNAISAVGRGNADHDAIRKYIMDRAAALGESDKIPDNWQADGSLKDESKSARGTLGRVKKRRHRAGLPAGREFRRFAVQDLEVRSARTGDAIELTGSPIVYNTPYSVFDMFGEFEETMKPGVASDVLANGADVRFLFNHDGLPLARTTSGTLRIADGPDRMQITAVLDARQQLANDLAVAVERGDVSQMSCGFQVGMDEWSDNETRRAIYRLDDLFDVSAVTYPASPTTSVELALRALTAAPVESRARVRRLYAVTKQLRAGRVLSAENATMLQSALEALHQADDVNIPGIIENLQTIDDALDAGQAGLAQVLGAANPDDDDPDDGGADEMTSTATRSAPGTAAERRAALTSFNDIERALYTALQERFGGHDGDETLDLWVEDCGTDWVVWTSYGDAGPGIGMWRLGYSTDGDGDVQLAAGDPVKVNVQTTYVPDDSADEPQETRSAALAALDLEAEQLRLRGQRRRGFAA